MIFRSYLGRLLTVPIPNRWERWVCVQELHQPDQGPASAAGGLRGSNCEPDSPARGQGPTQGLRPEGVWAEGIGVILGHVSSVTPQGFLVRSQKTSSWTGALELKWLSYNDLWIKSRASPLNNIERNTNSVMSFKILNKIKILPERQLWSMTFCMEENWMWERNEKIDWNETSGKIATDWRHRQRSLSVGGWKKERVSHEVRREGSSRMPFPPSPALVNFRRWAPRESDEGRDNALTVVWLS